MSGGMSAGAFTMAAISTAAAVSSAGMAIANSMGAPPTDAASGLLAQLTGKSAIASQQRSSLLATAGQSAGSPLSPGSVGGSSNVFGN